MKGHCHSFLFTNTIYFSSYCDFLWTLSLKLPRYLITCLIFSTSLPKLTEHCSQTFHYIFTVFRGCDLCKLHSAIPSLLQSFRLHQWWSVCIHLVFEAEFKRVFRLLWFTLYSASVNFSRSKWNSSALLLLLLFLFPNHFSFCLNKSFSILKLFKKPLLCVWILKLLHPRMGPELC